MKHFLWTVATLMAVFISGKALAEPAARPNVLLIVIDTLRADRIAAQRNGVPVMPKLHEFAEESWWFENANSEASWTKPSVVSILTSLYPSTHRVQFGIPGNWFKKDSPPPIEGIPVEKPTAMAYFKQHGYATAVVQSNRHLQPRYGFGYGCDAYDDTNWADGKTVTDLALGHAREMKGPFFLYAHYIDPHAPYGAPEPHRSAFGPVPEFAPEDKDWLEKEDHFGPYYMDKIMNDLGKKPQREFAPLSEQGRERLRMLYDGDCRYADAEVDRLIRSVLETSPNTIVVVTADHGEEFWEHGSIGHAKTVYQEVAHVPLLVRVPGMPSLKISARVETIDILPTLASATGLPGEAAWQGRSLLDPKLKSRPVFCETNGSLPETEIDKRFVIDGMHKLIRDHGNNAEVYDLKVDPREQKNLVEGDGEIRAALSDLLDKHIAAMQAHPAAQIPPAIFHLDDDTKRELEALGYIGGDK